MARREGEFTCKQCGHSFDKLPGTEEKDVRCPRCGSEQLERNPYLLGTPDAADLTLDDYLDVAMGPCCLPVWIGWQKLFYSQGNFESRPDSIGGGEEGR